MRPVFLPAVALVVVAFGGGVLADEKSDKKALEQLQGTYEIIGLEQDGMKLSKEDLKKLPDPKILKVTIKDSQIISNFTKSDDKATVKIDSSKKPSHFDIVTVAGGKTLTDHGIYKIEDGVLTICSALNSAEKDRPTDFKVAKNVIILKLQKQAK